MHFVCRTQLKRNILTFLAVALLLAVVGLLSYGLYTREPELIDPAEAAGEPIALDAAYGYSELTPQGFPCTVRLCGTPKVEGKDVYLNLTSPDYNIYLVRAEVYSVVMEDSGNGQQKPAPGKLLGKTGFIHPGTYVEKLRLDKNLNSGETPVYIKIALREKETGHSGGFFYLGTTFIK